MTLERWRHLVEIVAIAGAAVWAVYVFVYQERVKPANEPPEFQPAFSVQHTRLSSGKNLVKVDVEYRNAGQNTVYVAGDVINVYGVEFGDTLVVSTSNPAGSPDFARSLPLKRQTLLHSYVRKFQPFGNATSFIDIQPGTAFTGSFAFAIPARAFDALGLSWQTCFSKFSDRTWPVTLQRGHDGAYAFDIPDADWGAGLVCYADRRQLYPL
jgi:hypothetical protein